MKLELYAQHAPEDHTWVTFSVPADLERVLVDQLRKYPWVRVWGFRGEGNHPEQVECEMIELHEHWMPMA